MNSLRRIFEERRASRSGKSYTLELLADADYLGRKLREEAAELAEAEDGKDVRHEAADLLYFAAVKIFGAGVTFDEVLNALRSRQR